MMTRLINLILIFILASVIHSAGQTNLFDCENSKNFATYLFNTKQYELSQQELERISFFCEYDSTSRLTLLKTYRKLKIFDKEQLFFDTLGLGKLNQLSADYRDEYIRLLMTQQKYTEVQKEINEGLPFRQKFEHQLGTELLLKNWEKAYQLSRQENPKVNFKIAGLKKVAEKSYLAKRKSPFLATLMSVVIPGAGKMYCGYWGDGAMSFVFTASTTFFAIRGFNKYTTKSVYPWIVGGLAVSYYAANVYGGAKSAIRYNENLDNSFTHETEEILYSDY
jgi:TM2 domain-containing membrane protein YozV